MSECTHAELAAAAPRRAVVRTLVGAVVAGIGATVSYVVGWAAVGPALATWRPRWIRACRVDELETNVPTPVTLRVNRRDGYLETVDQKVVFVVRSETGDVKAMTSSCSHLGCSVLFNREKQQFLCPCHGGVFGLDGNVVAGPAPRPLTQLSAKVDNRRVFVEVV